MDKHILPDYLKSLIKMTLTHSILQITIPEVRFSVHDPIIEIKLHLEKRFGTKASSMRLILRSEEAENIIVMSDDYKNLTFYGAKENYIIHCIDENPNSILK